MSAYSTLNQTVLAKVETTAGIDSVPVVGTNAVLIEAPVRNPNLGTVETNEVTGALDDRGPLPAGGFSPFTGDVWLKGGDVAGTAPEYAPFLLGCGMAQTLTAAPISGSATAGAASSITVTSAAGMAIGMPISITSGTGSGQTRVITGIAALIVSVYPNWTTPPAAASGYSVPANALYKPTSTSLQTLSIYRYRHRSDAGNSKLDKILGAAGTFTLSLPVRNPGRFSFSYQGQLVAPVDVTPPAAATYQAARAQPYLEADTYLGGAPIKLNTLELDYGANVQLIDNPAQAFGYDAAGLTRRRISGTVNPPLELESVRNSFTNWLTGAEAAFWVRYGTVAGNRVSLFVPRLLYGGPQEADINGFAHESIPFRALGSDTGHLSCALLR